MIDEYKELMSVWNAYKEQGNNHGILFICDRLAELYEAIEHKSATEIYDTAYESFSRINLVAVGLNNGEYLRLRNYYKSLSNNTLIVREAEMIGDSLIKNFINPGGSYLLFDQQDLRQILYQYLQLGYVDIENSLYSKFDYIFEYCIRQFQKDPTDVIAIILIKGGDKDTIMGELRDSVLNKIGVRTFYAHNNSLGTATSIRVYFFDTSTKMNSSWIDRLNESVNVIRSSNEFPSNDL